MGAEELSFGDKRRGAELVRAESDTSAADELDTRGHSTWGEYKKRAHEYFRNARNPEWEKEVQDFFRALNESGERAIYLDACGTASGIDIRASKTYTFALQTPDYVKRRVPERNDWTDGDVLSGRDLRVLASRMIQGGDRPALITFEPYGGLEYHISIRSVKIDTENGGIIPKTDEEMRAEEAKVRLVYDKLATDLRIAIDLLRPGGYILIGEFAMDATAVTPRVADIPRDVPAAIERIARERGCSVERSKTGSYLLRKPLDALLTGAVTNAN